MNQDMTCFIDMKRTRDLQGCFLDGKNASYTQAKFPRSRTFASATPAGSIPLRGCRRPGAVSARAVLIGTRRVLRADYPLEWRPVRTAAGHPSAAAPGSGTRLTPGREAPPPVGAQVKVLVAAGLDARGQLWLPARGPSAARLRVLSLSGPDRGYASAGSRMLGVSAFHGFGPAIPAMTKLQRMGPSLAKLRVIPGE